MKRPSQAELQLRRELLAEKDNLSALVEETRHAIGKVAKHGYAELNKMPAQPYSAASVFPATAHSLLFGVFHLNPRTYERRNTMPDSPVPVPDNTEYVVAATSTITQTRMSHSPQLPIGLPGAGKQVAIQLHNTSTAQPSYCDALFYIGARGSASYGNQFRDTAPVGIIGDPRSPVYRASDKRYYYSSIESMRNDYAAGYSGALAVAGLVATSLEAVHGIESDTASIPPLLEAWQGVAVTERGAVSLDLARYLPRDLAAQA